jgi:MFS family permease
MNAIIAPDLVQDFHLDAEELGLLGSAFFYTFAIFQMPMGVLLDRVGPRRTISFFLLVATAGTLFLACANTFCTAFLGMAFIGAGMSSVLMGSFKVFVNRYPMRRFATLSGSIISIGALGSMLATSPLVYLNSIIGWRSTLIYSGLITAALSAVIFYLLDEGHTEKKKHMSQVSPHKQKMAIMKPIQILVSHLFFWQIGLMAFFRYGTFGALQGVWLGPYLMVVKHFHPITAGNILMMLSVGSILGSPLAGYLAEKVIRNTKFILMLGVGCYTLLLLPLTGIWNVESAIAYSVLFFFLGFFNGFGMLAFLHIKELCPLHISGTAMAGINFFVMAGGAFFIQAIGLMISLFVGTGQGDPLEAYQRAFLVCFIAMAGGLTFYAFSKSKQS